VAGFAVLGGVTALRGEPAEPRPVEARTQVEVAPPAPEPVKEPVKEPVTRVDAPARRSRPVGYLSMRANIDGQVWNGSKLLGSLPLRRVAVSPGKLQLRVVSKALGVQKNVSAVVASDQETTVDVAVGKGTINVNAEPWAEVWLDGVMLGQTPLSREVWEGPHGVRLVGPEKNEKSLAVSVKSGATAVVHESLR
ncbi:MAG: hypothetical protein JNK82_26330, partial [Myxococcaceae bacterium]|nr:hypothetical protein [Myxococcaceae bacterium]